MSEVSRLDDQVDQWRAHVARGPATSDDDVAELEEHLRESIGELRESGLSDDEAFLIGVKRLGRLDALSREFATEHSHRLWKQLVLGDDSEPRRRVGGLGAAVLFAVLAAAWIKLPALFGLFAEVDENAVARNAAVLVLPVLAAYLLTLRRASAVTYTIVAGLFIVAGVVLNVYPFADPGSSLTVAILHSLVALWLVVGIAYVNGRVRAGDGRMNFIRFSGEWLVYLVLILAAGLAVSGVIALAFAAVNIEIYEFVVNWIAPCGSAAAIIIAAWLVEEKRGVIENIVPVLAKLMTPLFTLALLSLIVPVVIQRDLVDMDRWLLIAFDAVLIVAVALLVYTLSSRDPDRPAGWFDWVQLVMIVAALIVDLVVMSAMIGRIGEFGVSINKLTSLSINLILLVNLLGAAWNQWGFLRRKKRFEALEHWQTSFLPVYFGWSLLMVIVAPPVFGFV